MRNHDYGSADSYDNYGWIVKPKRRVEITKDRETGYWVIMDTKTGERVGNSQTMAAAKVIRRKYEARGCQR